MRGFYKYLLRGYSKARAMKMAKIDYLKAAPAEKQNPFYWSTYIVIGNPAPIYYPQWIVKLTILLMGALIIIFLYKILKTRKNRMLLKDPYS